MGRQHRAAYIPPFRDVACERMAGGLCLREKPHVSDDETVANMGHPIWLFFFFLEDEVGGRGAGGDFGLMGHACGDVGDVSDVEDCFFSALDAGAEAGWAGLCGGQEFGFALLKVGGGVDGLGDEGGGGDEGEGQDDAAWHSCSLKDCQIVLGGFEESRTTPR